MKTRYEIKKVLNDFAASHIQINTFGYGEEFEQQAVEGVEYPLLWAVALPSPLSGVDYDRVYRLIVCDRVRKDETDEIHVETDTELILLDAVSYLKKYSDNNDFQLIETTNINPFTEKWSDECTGFYADITLRDFFDFNSCELPLSDEIPVGEFPDNNSVYISPFISSKALTIPSPELTDDIPIFFTFTSVQVKQINDVLAGTTPELSYNIYYDEDKNSVSPTKLWVTDRTATSQAGAESEVFDNPVIPINNWVWIKYSDIQGTVTLFSFNVFYKTVI